MQEIKKDSLDEHLTQKDIVQLLLHNPQHMVTREELKSDIKELKDDLKHDILNVEDKISKVEVSLKQDISKVEASLKQDISKVEDRISKISDKFDKVQWLIVATLLTVVFKDHLISVFQ